MSRFAEKTVLITGGTRGIGLACAEAFAREGASVAICGRDTQRAEAAAAGIDGNVRGFGCDVGDAASVDALMKQAREELGVVSILVNNAGLAQDGLLMRMKNEHWDKVIATNLSAAFYTCRAAARDMLKQRYGRIVNISSVVGLRGQAGQANYAASKAGLIGFTKAYAREVASRNITVNAVAPGFTETDMIDGMTEAMKTTAMDAIPMKRIGAPADIAAAVLFLASEDAAYVTGAVLPVDGGMAM